MSISVCWKYNPKALRTTTSDVALLLGQTKLRPHVVLVFRVVKCDASSRSSAHADLVILNPNRFLSCRSMSCSSKRSCVQAVSACLLISMSWFWASPWRPESDALSRGSSRLRPPVESSRTQRAWLQNFWGKTDLYWGGLSQPSKFIMYIYIYI